MNPLREMILNEIVKPEVRLASKTYIGTIQSVNMLLGKADVRLGDQGDELYENVPFSRGMTYIHGAAPKQGTPVLLSFLNGDITYPYIISIIDDEFVDDTTGKTLMIPEQTTGTERGVHADAQPSKGALEIRRGKR